jgi:pyruvate,water dikinase
MHMAREIAAHLSPKKFGVKKVFLLGNTAKPASDIDLAVNFAGTEIQKQELDNWFNGWSLALDEVNFMRTGFKAGGLLDIYYVDDETAESEQTIAGGFDIINPAGIKELELKVDE